MGILEHIFGKEYHYYDTPDGEDCLQKLGFLTKYCGVYGIILSSVDVLMYSHPQGYPQILARYAAVTLPVMGMGAAFASTTCIATNFRKKDDIWNYYLGGAAAGAVAGAAKKSLKVGSYAAFFLGAAAAVKKDFDLRGWSFVDPNDSKIVGDFRFVKRDFSITADPGKV